MSEIINAKKPRKPRTKKIDMLKKKEAEKDVEHIPKKRGRKPKGGKIVKKSNILLENEDDAEEIIILHLKCKLSDASINTDRICDVKYTPDVVKEIKAYSNGDDEKYFTLDVAKDVVISVVDECSDINKDELKEYKIKQKNKRSITNKLKDLERRFNLNDVNKKSACFWCTCEFASSPIYIPSLLFRDRYDVYGCFCSPECASSHLFNENLDNNTKFERYQLLNFLYGKIYGYTKEIKQAPNPFYTLEKFYGNLSIQEYRQLLEYDRLILIINKPITKIFPEIHEDNNEFEMVYDNKVTLKKTAKKEKTNVIRDTFSSRTG